MIPEKLGLLLMLSEILIFEIKIFGMKVKDTIGLKIEEYKVRGILEIIVF